MRSAFFYSKSTFRAKGFTLIELLVTLGIVAILAAIAIPSYRDYAIKARVSEMIQMLGPVKVGVSEYYYFKNRFPNTSNEIQITFPKSNAVTEIKIEDGKIIITGNNLYLGLNSNDGNTLEYQPRETPGKAIIWECVGGTLEKYRPFDCPPVDGGT